jgi:hypothetical protein
MTRTKLGLLGLCAVMLGMMAMSASPAQASLFKWLILNSAGTVASELKALLVSETDNVDLTLVTHLLGRLFWVTCTSVTLNGVNLEILGKLTTGGRVKFTGCEAYGNGALVQPLGCKVHSPGTAVGTIETNKIKGELLLHEGTLVMKVEPEVGESFVTLETEGCIMPEATPIRGKFFIKDCLSEAAVHKVKHLIEDQKTLTKLWAGVHNEEHLLTTTEGSAWVKLASSADGPHVGLEWAGIHNAP